MNRANANKNGKQRKRNVRPLGTRNPTIRKGKRAGGRDDASAFKEYIQMLADPCSGKIVRAPYSGMGSSYLVRTVNTYQPQTAGVFGQLDTVLEWTPWNSPSSLTTRTGAANTSLTLTTFPLNNFVTNQTVVKSYRPIAACAKWVPTSPIATRQGNVGRAYSPSKIHTNGAVTTAQSCISSTNVQDPNGSVRHEVVWLPSFGDERFSSNGEVNINGAGSCTIVCLQCDATNDGASSYTAGYFEFTVVWEWEPQADDAFGAQSGIPPSVSPTTRYTLQDVLSGIRDVGSFVLGSARQMSQAYQWAVGGQNMHGQGFPLLM